MLKKNVEERKQSKWISSPFVNKSPKTTDFPKTSHRLLMTSIKTAFSKIILNLIVIESNWHYSLINE